MDEENKRFLLDLAAGLKANKVKPPIRFKLTKHKMGEDEPVIYHSQWSTTGTVLGEMIELPAGKNRIDALVADGFVSSLGGMNYEVNHRKVIDWFEALN